jgi:copper chaperone
LAEHLTLNVHGMTCGGCENAVKRAVSMVGGVSAVTASHKDHRVTVEFDASKTTRAAIERAVQNAGYEVATAR